MKSSLNVPKTLVRVENDACDGGGLKAKIHLEMLHQLKPVYVKWILRPLTHLGQQLLSSC